MSEEYRYCKCPRCGRQAVMEDTSLICDYCDIIAMNEELEQPDDEPEEE